MHFLSLSLVTATIIAAHQMLAAQTPPAVGILAGHRVPVYSPIVPACAVALKVAPTVENDRGTVNTMSTSHVLN